VAIGGAARDVLLAHFTKKWRNRTCPVCGTARWDLQGHITLTLADKPGEHQFIVGGPGMPCVAAICQECGNTLLFNLVVAGVVAGGTAPSP
jgi:hypothetical protein